MSFSAAAGARSVPLVSSGVAEEILGIEHSHRPHGCAPSVSPTQGWGNAENGAEAGSSRDAVDMGGGEPAGEWLGGVRADLTTNP
jgi:hypothetical protein